MPDNATMDKLIEAHKKATHPNEEPYLMKKPDNTGLYRVLKSSTLKVKYYLPGTDSNKTKQISFAKLNGEVDNGTIPKVAVMLSQMVDGDVIQIVDAEMQSNFYFSKERDGLSVVGDEIYEARDKAEGKVDEDKEVTN